MAEKENKYADKSVEELLDMNIEDIDELKGFQTLPEGIYSGVVGPWELPNAENSNAFVQTTSVTGIVELEDPEQEFEVTDDTEVQSRYFKSNDFSISAMRTNWEDYFVKKGGGNIGAAFANGEGTEIVFRIEHRYQMKDANGKKLPKPKGPYAEIKDVTVAE